MDLFAAVPQRVVDDAEGGIRYFPDIVDGATADAWFAALRDGARWKLAERPMYDRVVAIPRMLASYALAKAPPGLPFPEMLAAVRRHVDAPFNGIGMNLYRDGTDSVAMHGDKLHSIVAPYPIALVSLGAPRRMLVRANAPGARAVGIDLQPGSLLVMSHASQSTHEHGIPKTRTAVGPRMSVVFRVRAKDDLPYDG
jgi:alkylated DNA repair dioxygenase AlkB